MFSFTVTRRDGQRVVTFDADVDTREAYDMTQTTDDIHDGDVLVVQSEGVVGVLVSAWPCAVGTHHGEFHRIGVDADLLGHEAAFQVAYEIEQERQTTKEA